MGNAALADVIPLTMISPLTFCCRKNGDCSTLDAMIGVAALWCVVFVALYEALMELLAA